MARYYGKLAAMTALHFAQFLVIALCIHWAAPGWHQQRVLLWSLIVFVITWRAAGDVKS